jgi:hypothetical protein
VTALTSRWSRAAKAKMSGRRKLGIAFAAVLVIAGLGAGIGTLVHYRADAEATCMNQGVTIVMHEGVSGQCVGITDGSYQFDPADSELVNVENAIEAQDRRVRDQGRYVSVAYLMPISATGGVEPVQTVAEQLQGAYAAQSYANGVSHDVDGFWPHIQLLIASSGTQADEYGRAVRDIENDESSQHLAAVDGIGVSLDSTVAEVHDLASHSIPVFGASITSDAFDNIQNMVRISPSNQQEVTAVLNFIKPQAKTAFLIQDTNPTDSYDSTLVTEFRDDFPDGTHHIVAIESYNTAGDAGGTSQAAQAVANRIGLMTSDICADKAGVVLFAGRGRDLATLLTALGTRPCLTQPITIVTGDDVTDMPITASVKQGLATGVTLDYAGEANPDEWKNGSSQVIQNGRDGYSRFIGEFTRLFPNVSVNDGSAMMGWDAMLTSISAIHLAGKDGVIPGPAGIAEDLSALQGPRGVQGASGPIDLSADWQGSRAQGSNPVGKVIPILRLEPNGNTAFVRLELPPF